jgi:hypothetical protein
MLVLLRLFAKGAGLQSLESALWIRPIGINFDALAAVAANLRRDWYIVASGNIKGTVQSDSNGLLYSEYAALKQIALEVQILIAATSTLFTCKQKVQLAMLCYAM